MIRLKWVLVVPSLAESDGGPPVAVLETAAALARLDQVVHVVFMTAGERLPESAIYKAQEAGVELHSLRLRRLGAFRPSLRFLFLTLRVGRRADVIVNHGFYQFPTIASWVAHTANRKSKFFSQPHGVFEPYQEQIRSGRKRLFRLVVGEYILSRYDLFLASSNQEARGLEVSIGAQPSIISVNSLGIRQDNSNLVPYANAYGSRKVLFLSRIAFKKRLDLLIEACRLAAGTEEQFTVLVCGSGEEGFVQTLVNQSIGLPVEFLGHVSGTYRREIEDECSLFCLPSDNENFGQAVTEAMAVGLPVITTTTTGASDHVAAAGCGWVLRQPTAAQLTATITSALADPDDLALKSNRAVTYATSESTWKEVAESWISLAVE